MPKHLFIKEDPDIKQKALKLYKQGFTMREVGKMVKRSRQWVCNVIKELTAIDKGSGYDNIKTGVEKSKVGKKQMKTKNL